MRIEVIATDGERIRRIAWVRRTRNGIYWGWSIRGMWDHVSYHEQGTRHTVISRPGATSIHLPEGRSVKLSEFKGRAQWSGAAFRKDLKLLPVADYKMQEVDGVVYIDLRMIQKSFVNLDLQLVEAGKMDSIYRISGAQISIFTSMTPWLVVQFW